MFSFFKRVVHRKFLSATVLTTALVLLTSVPSWAQLQVSADIQVGSGDGMLSDSQTIAAGSGDTVVIEVFATGISASQGFEAKFRLNDPAAVSSVTGTNQGGPYQLALPSSVSGDVLNLSVGALFSPVTIDGAPQFVGSLTIVLSSTLSSLTLELFEADGGAGASPQSVTLTVADAGSIPIASGVAADLNVRAANQNQTNGRVNPGRPFPIQVFGQGLVDITGYEIHATVGNAENFDLTKANFIAGPKFTVTPAASGSGGGGGIPTPVASSSPRAAADIAVGGAGDGVYNPENLSVAGEPGGIIALELFGTGYTDKSGFEAIIEVSNPDAISSVDINIAAAFPLKLSAPSFSGNTITANLGFLGSTSAPSEALALLGTVTISLGSNISDGVGLTVKSIAFQDASTSDLVETNAVLNVTQGGGPSTPAPIATVEVSGNTLIAKATAATPVAGNAALGAFALTTSSGFTGGQVTISQVIFSTAEKSQTLEPGVVLNLRSAVSNLPVVTRPPIPVTVTDTRAVIQWETNTTSTGKVLYGTDRNSLTLEATSSTESTLHRVRINDLTLGTQYFFQVSNTDANGTSDPFPNTPRQFVTKRKADTVPPRVLRGPAALGITNNRADVVLQTDEAARVDVLYGTDQNDLSLTATRTSSQVEHQVALESLTAGTTYFYRVKLTDLNGNDVTSGTKSFKTKAGVDSRPPRILGRPTILGRTSGAAVIAWDTDEASNSSVSYGTEEGSLTQTVTVSETERKHRIALGNLLSGVQYFYQVSSTDASGNTAISRTAHFITSSSEDTQAPIIVRLPVVPRRSDSQALVVFETNEPTTATVQFDTTTAVYDDETGTVGETVNASDAVRKHEITLTNLTAGKRYYYKVSVTDLSDNGPTNNKGQLRFATRVGADTQAPIVFSRPIAKGITQNGAIITWGADEPHSAVIRYGMVAAGKQATSADLTEELEDIEFTRKHKATLSDLTAGTRYIYEVQTTDAAGNSSSTSNLTFTTAAGEDNSAPVILRGPVARNITPTSATINWVTDEVADSRVSWGTTTDYSDNIESSSGEVVHSVTLTGLEAGTVYHYAVGSADQSGNVVTTDASGTTIGLSKDHTFRTPATEDTQPPVILNGPIIQSRDDDTAVIEWITDELSTSTVAIGVASSSTGITDATPVFGAASQLEFEDNELVIKHSVTVTGLTGGSAYLFQVSSTDAAGNAVSSVTPTASKLQPPGGFGSFTTSTESDTQFPVITSGPTVVASTSSSLTITWETDESANSIVNFGTSSSGAAKQTTTTLSDQEIDGTNVTSHQVTLTKLTSGTTYAYQVASIDASGNGETTSSTAYGTTASDVDLTAPVISTAPSVVYKSDRSATISWVTNEVANSEIAYGTSATELINVRSNPDFETEHTLTLTNLDASTEYHFQVSSADQNNNGPVQSSVISFTTEGAPDTQNPTVSDVTVSAADSSATITWTTDELSDSAVKYGTATGTYDFNSGDATDVTGHSVTLTNLSPNTTYFYVVESIDASANGPTQSTEASFITLAAGSVQAPDAPSGLVVSGGNGAIKVFWAASPSAGVTGYTVERATDGNYSPVASLDAVTAYVDNNVVNGTAYTYRISAIGAKQLSSEASSSSEAVTPSEDSGPGAPTLFGIQGTATAPTIVINNGTPINADDVLSYTFHIATSSDFSDAITVAAGIASGAGLGSGDPSGVTAWTVDRTLTDGTTYHYRIKGSDGAFDSSFLTGAFVVDGTAPEFPGDLTGDLAVNFPDFLSFIGSFNKNTGDDGFLDGADLNRDGSVGFPDFLSFISNFNKQYIKGPSSGKVVTPLVYGIDATAQFQLTGRHINTSQASDELAVDIRLANVTDLKGYGVQVNYDPATVQFVDASDKGETFLQSGDRQSELFGVLSHDAEKGEVFISGAITQGATVSGEGTLATLKFRIIGSDPSAALIEIAQGLLIDGKLTPSAAQNLGQRFALLPTEYALEHNFPNPFNPETTIRYAVPDAGKVTLTIYSILGQEIARLVDTDLLPGFYTVRWDGKDATGRGVASGIYLYRMQAGDFAKAHKMLLLK